MIRVLDLFQSAYNSLIYSPIYLSKNELIIEEKRGFLIHDKKAIIVSQINKIEVEEHDTCKIQIFSLDFFDREEPVLIQYYSYKYYLTEIKPLLERLKRHPNFWGDIKIYNHYETIC